MSIDSAKLINQYVQSSNYETGNFLTPNQEKQEFERTLSRILSENQKIVSSSGTAKGSDASGISTGNPDLEGIFQKAADTYDVPVELLKAMGKAESGFRSDAVSSCGAMGIMQLMPSTAKALGVVDAFDPEQNIMGGANYISQKLKAYDGDITLALAAYNAGSGNVAKYGGVPPFKETQNYIKKITGYMGEDISLPMDNNRGIKVGDKSLTGLLSGEQTYSQLGSEKAYFLNQMKILRHQLDMQELFASGNSKENEDAENLEINRMIDSLSRL